MVSQTEVEANSKFVEEEYEEALQLFSEALEKEPKNANLYVSRAATHIKLENFTDAVADANKAIGLDPSFSKAYLRKGIACFSLEEYQTALSVFKKGSELDPNSSQFKTWVRKCLAELEEEGDFVEEEETPSKSVVVGDTSGQNESTPMVVDPSPSPSPSPLTSAVSSPSPPSQPLAPATPVTPKFRREWYQTPGEVVVTVFAKNVDKERLHVEFGEQILSLMIDLPEEEPYVLQERLFGKIVPSKSKYVLFKTKVEVKLAKAETIQWTALEYSGRKGVVQPINFSDGRAEAAKSKYPSSSKKNVVDWDKLEAEVKKEEKSEKLDGDAALNKLFQDIYGNADEDTRRAMNKSFVESNGTVLSTNWNEIGSKKIEPHP